MTCHNMTGGGCVLTTSVSGMYTRRIGLATRNQLQHFSNFYDKHKLI